MNRGLRPRNPSIASITTESAQVEIHRALSTASSKCADAPTICPALVSLKLAQKKRHFMAQLNNAIPLDTSFSATWKDLYECAMLELDKSKLSERIGAARRAIVDRAEEIVANQSDDEHYSLNDALRALQLLEQLSARENPTA
jgi:hypothetical protein